ncbi:MAG: NUDIX domain-containing protein [Actinomyces sp.]|nr:NUDIX domain-containing protein [Actinomyces sp.]MCI1641504.1 NUDIX domain-containing protein [Actinomyces sp.]MCI1661752.1 NUDIX domain-containing protein [Actinomyces sp.]MCI1690500.1 NUDIX domain-containing protein [Actinomyces sp.]MCI1786481.1 NUDIX domain-containing protein [Actinomyces sp.]MCI1829998.1 NUDIX domain-containing protein [Actinomyces sp.]
MSKSSPSPVPSRLVRAGGAVTWRLRSGARALPGQSLDPADLEVLLVHRPRYGDWSWPKGKAELNEPLPVTAVREVEEETGQVVALGAPLTTQRYRLGSGQTKEVHYWVGTPLEEGAALRTRRPVEGASHREIDARRWVSPSRARALLTRRGDRRLLTEVVARAESGTLITSVVALLRHAKAVSRSSWEGDEAERPLTRLGVQQAIDLIDMLSAFGVEQIVSSPWLRCASTVGPYATAAGLAVDARPELTEDAAASDPLPASRVMEQLASGAPAPVVVCAHRPTLPVLMEPLAACAPTRVQADLPRESPWLSTAEMLVAHVARASRVAASAGDGAVVTAVERHATYTKLVLPD